MHVNVAAGYFIIYYGSCCSRTFTFSLPWNLKGAILKSVVVTLFQAVAPNVDWSFQKEAKAP